MGGTGTPGATVETGRRGSAGTGALSTSVGSPADGTCGAGAAGEAAEGPLVRTGSGPAFAGACVEPGPFAGPLALESGDADAGRTCAKCPSGIAGPVVGRTSPRPPCGLSPRTAPELGGRTAV